MIRGSSKNDIGSEMAHQLYVLQNLMFSLLEERRMTRVEPNDQVGHGKGWGKGQRKWGSTEKEMH